MKTTHNSADILPVIDRIYQASLDTECWPEAVQSVAALYDSDKALMMTPGQLPHEGGLAVPVGIPVSAMQEWETRYAPHDVWVQQSVARGLFQQGRVVCDEDLYPHEALLATVWYREFLSRIGVARLLSGVVFGADSPGSPPALISVFRGIEAQPFVARDRELHALLIPHISRALGILFRLRDAEMRMATSLAALDRSASGIVLIGESGHVVFANRAAQDLLRQEDGLMLKTLPGSLAVLCARDPRDNAALMAAVAQCLKPAVLAVAHFGQVLPIRRPSGRMAYALNLSSLPVTHDFGSGPDRAHAIIFIRDPEQPPALELDQLRRHFGLTAAECRLLPHLCSGETLAALARTLGLSEATVKTQMRGIFEKTQTRRRAQLVQLLRSFSLG